jgi:deazaflavin-dependent oxidoreductase (nitroreductase family)
MRSPSARYSRPGTAERLLGQALVALLRAGIVRGHFYVLEVRGRKSGRVLALPVDPLDFDGKRYLVCARGDSNWVKNARAAGEVVLARARRRQRFAVREVAAGNRPPILKAYLDRYAREVQRFFPVPRGSPETSFEGFAVRYPVFELTALNDTEPRPNPGSG